MNPTAFGQYQLLEKIGAGGMAEVFRAKKSGAAGFERIVAIKRIHPELVGDPQFLEMFIDEAKIAVQLHHANIAQVFDLGMVQDQYYIALEHIHGRDLKQIFGHCRKRGEALPIKHACFIAMEILSGLDYAHNQRTSSGEDLKLVHRDISLQNVLVSFDGEVKLIDFGIAKATGRASKTRVGVVKGKFAYMSPEQLRGLPVDRRSDVFSAGTVLFELLTGQRLFLGESTLQTIQRVRSADVPSARALNAAIPKELETVLEKALTVHPEDRYQTAGEFYDAIEAFVRSRWGLGCRRGLASWLQALMPEDYQTESARLASLGHDDAVRPSDGSCAYEAVELGEVSVLAEGSSPSDSVEILFDETSDETSDESRNFDEFETSDAITRLDDRASDEASVMVTVPVPRLCPSAVFGPPPAAAERTLIGFYPPPKIKRPDTARVCPPARPETELVAAAHYSRANRVATILALAVAVVLGVGAGLWALNPSSGAASVASPLVPSAPSTTPSTSAAATTADAPSAAAATSPQARD